MVETVSAPPSLIETHTPEGDTLSVNPLGAKLTLIIGDTSILTSVMRGDGKPGITHPCTPIFGPDVNAVYGLSQHGNMRNELCNVTLTSPNEITVKHDVTDNGYPHGMKVEQVLTIDKGTFSLSFMHENTGEEAAAVNACEHCYFDAPQGHSGATINGHGVTDIIQDSVRGVVIDLRDENIINIPGKPEMVLKQEGFSKAALWIGKNPVSGNRDDNYVCIEPIEYDPNKFGSAESMIPPGGKRTARFSLTLNKH